MCQTPYTDAKSFSQMTPTNAKSTNDELVISGSKCIRPDEYRCVSKWTPAPDSQFTAASWSKKVGAGHFPIDSCIFLTEEIMGAHVLQIPILPLNFPQNGGFPAQILKENFLTSNSQK